MKWSICFLVILVCSCNLSFKKEDKRVQALNDMQQTDVDFAEFASEQGFRKAFLEYMDADAILLRDNRLPIIGADAIEYISSINDSTFRLAWEPQGGDVGKSGDLGFTFGTYTLSNDSAVQKGTYVTVWRLQQSGKWKFLLDASTQGLDDIVAPE